MKISHLKEALKFGIKIQRPILVASMPGIGKSTAAAQVADGMNGGFIPLQASTMLPEDIGELPYVDIIDRIVRKAAPEGIPTDETVASGQFPKKGIINVDELGDCPIMVQSALYRMILDHHMGNTKIADGWYVMGCTNRQEDRAATGRMSTALANRFIHITLDVDHNEVIAYAQKNGWDMVVPAFLKFRPIHVSSFDPKNKEHAFASPRTWEYTSDILKNDPPAHLRLELLSGTLGEGIAIELEGFIQVMDELMSWQDILNNPDHAPIPERPAAQWAVCSVLAHNADLSNLDAVVTYAERMTPDMSTFLIMSAVNRNTELLNHKAFTQRWAPKHGDVCNI